MRLWIWEGGEEGDIYKTRVRLDMHFGSEGKLGCIYYFRTIFAGSTVSEGDRDWFASLASLHCLVNLVL